MYVGRHVKKNGPKYRTIGCHKNLSNERRTQNLNFWNFCYFDYLRQEITTAFVRLKPVGTYLRESIRLNVLYIL